MSLKADVDSLVLLERKGKYRGNDYPINGNDLGSVAEKFDYETPTNPEPEAEEVVEATEDTQTEAIEDAAIEDVDDISDIDEEQLMLRMLRLKN